MASTRALARTPKTTYRDMLQAVKGALAAGYLDIQRALEYERVKTYWTLGTEIRKRAEASGGALKLDEALYARISRDIKAEIGLNLTPDTLRRAVRFGKVYARFPENTPLTFTHYLALMRVSDAAQRLRLERQAVDRAMGSNELREKVLSLNAAPALPPPRGAQVLPVERGEPYVYNARPFEDLAGRQNMCIDCGFKIHVPLKGAIIKRRPAFSQDTWRTVRVIKENGDYDVRLAVRKRNSVYTYAARVLKAVDGDTLDALIDVGFGIRVQERFRLKGIDAPEIKTRAGMRAREWLVGYLSRCPIIVVRTSKTGMYGRWLGDLFTLPGAVDPRVIAAEGEYLNQTLLDRGLAVRYA